MTSGKGEEVRQRLRELVDSTSPGHRLPAERDLTDRFHVARETLRRAVEDFIAQGLLERRRGVGTFVTRPKITQQFRVQSFTQDMQARGMTSSSVVVSAGRRTAGVWTAAALRLGPEDEVFSIRRLRLADGDPMALESLFLPVALVPDLDTDALEHQSLYELLAARYGLAIASGTQTIEATVTDEADSDLLRVPPLSPALQVDRITWTAEGRRVESVRSIYRGDRYRFEVELTGGPAHAVSHVR